MGKNLKIDRSKWENFWYYYKAHVIVGIFITVVLMISLKDCSNRVEPDISIAYIGSSYIQEETIEEFKEQLSNLIKDINNDGKIEVAFLPLTVPGEIKSEQDMAIGQRIMLEYAAGDSIIYFIDSNNFKRDVNQGAFEPLEQVVQKYNLDIDNIDDVKLTLEGMDEEHIYAIPLEGNALLEQIGFPTKDTYMAIRTIRDKEKKQAKKLDEYENANAILEEIIKYVN